MLHQNAAAVAGQTVGANQHQPIAIGDIINWPQAEGRLALVVEVGSLRGWKVLTIAPAAADRGQAARRSILRIIKPNELRQSGLPGPVRFDLDHCIGVSPGHPALRDGGSPVAGRLCGAALERLHAARARIHALRDIAAERRAERRGRQGDRRTGWRRAPWAAAAEQGKSRA